MTWIDIMIWELLMTVLNLIKGHFEVVHPENACKLVFYYHWWLPFLDQTHPDVVVLTIIDLYIYNIIVEKWKHGVGPNYIITFNE